MRICIKLYSDFKRYAPDGKDLFDLILPPGATLLHCFERLGIPRENAPTALINSRRAALDSRFEEGDTLVIFPQICGG